MANGRFAMPIPLRRDFQASQLRLAARRTKDGPQARRLLRVNIAKQTMSRELRAVGYRKLSARPRHHAQAEGAVEDFKKAFPAAWRRSRRRKESMHPP